MLNRYQTFFSSVFRMIDVLIITTIWLASYWLRFSFQILPVTKGLPEFQTYASLTPLVAVLWLVVFSSMRVYRFSRLLGPLHEVLLVLKAHGLALLLFIALTYLFEEYKYSRLVILFFGTLSGAALVLGRLSVRSAFRAMRKRGFNQRRILLVGEGRSVESLVTRLERFPELGLRVAGVVTHEDSTAETVCGKPVLGHFGDITQVIDRARADEVLIALQSSQQSHVSRLLELLKDETLDVRLVPDVHAYVTLGCDVEDFDGVPVVRINDSPLIGWRATAKRSTDLVVASVCLVLLSPLLMLIATLVKLTSSGEVLFRQERMGLDGRTFGMLKFRSMRLDAESRTGAVWAQASDDRRTMLGTILRKTSLDELPQLWNVLRGEMSLVGPRPERPVFVKQFRNEIPQRGLRYLRRDQPRTRHVAGWGRIGRLARRG